MGPGNHTKDQCCGWVKFPCVRAANLCVHCSTMRQQGTPRGLLIHEFVCEIPISQDWWPHPLPYWMVGLFPCKRCVSQISQRHGSSSASWSWWAAAQEYRNACGACRAINFFGEEERTPSLPLPLATLFQNEVGGERESLHNWGAVPKAGFRV